MPYETQPDYVEFVYDNGGRTVDRYTIQWSEGDTYGYGYASPDPYWPQGVGMYGGDSHIGDPQDDEVDVAWSDLPEQVRRFATEVWRDT